MRTVYVLQRGLTEPITTLACKHQSKDYNVEAILLTPAELEERERKAFEAARKLIIDELRTTQSEAGWMPLGGSRQSTIELAKWLEGNIARIEYERTEGEE